MKICHIAHQTWPAVCGSVSRLENILSAQKKSGIHPFVISSPFQSSSTEGVDTEKNNGVTYYRHKDSESDQGGIKNQRTLSERIMRAFSIVPFTKRVIEICKKENPDIIHAHATFAMGIPALIAGFALRKKVVYEMRSTWEDDISGGVFIGLQKRLIKHLEHFVASQSDSVFFVSNGILNHYFNSPPQNYQIIHNCVPLPQQDNIPAETGRRYAFGYIGSIVYYEGLETLLEASSILSKKRDDFIVNIYGDGKERPELEALALRTNNDKVKFHGRIDFANISDAYSNIDCIVLPRKNLPITQKVAGLKPVEAFAYRKLVLASDVGGMRELFTDKTHGYLFEAEEPLALAELMEKAMDNEADSDAVKQRAFEHYQKEFTLESMGKKYLSAYQKALIK